MDKEDEDWGAQHSAVHVQSPEQRRPAKDRSPCSRGRGWCPQRGAATTVSLLLPCPSPALLLNIFPYSEPFPANSDALAPLLLGGGRWNH